MTKEEQSRQYADNRLAEVDPSLAKTNYKRDIKMNVNIFDGQDIEQAWLDGYNAKSKELENNNQ